MFFVLFHFYVLVLINHICKCFSVRMRENEDQNNSEYGQFLRSVFDITKTFMTLKIN